MYYLNFIRLYNPRFIHVIIVIKVNKDKWKNYTDTTCIGWIKTVICVKYTFRRSFIILITKMTSLSFVLLKTIILLKILPDTSYMNK